MKELGFHLRMSLEDGRVIAPTTAAQRTLARAVFAADRDRKLLAMRAPDTHLHLQTATDRRRAGRLAWRIARCVRPALELPVRFSNPHFEPIRNQAHGYNAFRYILRQDERHDVCSDPFAEASNLPDLLGMRLPGRYTAGNVARRLPRVRAERLAAHLGVTLEQLRHGRIAREALEQLHDASAAAVALPTLSGMRADVVAARCAAVHLARDVVRPSRVAELLGLSTRTVRRLRQCPVNPNLVEAIARQLRLRTFAPFEPDPAARRFPLGADRTPD